MTAHPSLRAARVVLVIGLLAAIIPAIVLFLGLEAVATLFIPVALAAVPLLTRTPAQFRSTSFVGGALILGFAIVGGFSVGIFFVPSALAVLAAGELSSPARTAA